MAQLTIQQAFDLAVRQHQAGRLHEAESLYRQIVAIDSGFFKAHCNLGLVLAAQGRLDEAIAAYRAATAIHPNLAEAHNNLGNALKEKGELDEAIAVFRRALALKPEYAEAHNNLGAALLAQGHIDEAIAAHRQAVAFDPRVPDIHYNLSLDLLTRGDLQQGWEEYEWRWKLPSFQPYLRRFSQPLWDGSPLDGRTILLYAEQGYGDAIQFIRYVPLVAQRGGKIVIECGVELRRLFQSMAGICQIVVRAERLPAFDVHAPLLSLPRIFGTTLNNVPDSVSYLSADPADITAWGRRMDRLEPAVKVGLAWAGRPTHLNDANRSIKLAMLAPLAKVSGVRFFSLQKGAAAEQVASDALSAGIELIDFAGDLNDYADTAALIANLDLVIAVDTSVVHLAGAMGKLVWVLLPFVPDWRWTMTGERSPWYPTARLFRQASRGDWTSVIRRVVEGLSLWAQNGG
jgi:hypothetical protein